MNKITEDDLKKLFDDDLEEVSPDENWHGFKESESEPVRVRRVTKSVSEQKDIKKVRRQIKNIKTKRTRRKTNLDQILRFMSVSSFFAFIFFVAMNYPGLKRQFEWLYFNEYLNQEVPVAVATPKPEPTAIPDQVPVLTVPQSREESDRLVIEKLKINAPVIWDVQEADIIKKLNDGIVHYGGTSKPGGGGNVFLVGHSSNYVWVNSPYNSIFAILDKLVKGDRIEVKYNEKSYYYDVIETKIIKPEQVEVLSNTNKEVLSMMTCWPIGTTLNRMVVIAELKYSSSWVNQELLSQ